MNKILAGIAVVLIALGLVFGAWYHGKTYGAGQIEVEAAKNDAKNATEVKKRADSVVSRGTDDPIGVLESAGRLRD